MEWLVIDEDYLSYLRSVENRIPFSNYGNDKYKPFLVFYLRLTLSIMLHKFHTPNHDMQ